MTRPFSVTRPARISSAARDREQYPSLDKARAKPVFRDAAFAFTPFMLTENPTNPRMHNPATLGTMFSADREKEFMAHQHPPRFLKIVDDAKTRVRETNVDAVKKRLDRGEKFILVDVREESEFAKDHLPGAIHLGKGIIERDIEARVPDLGAEIVLYCGGGFRSALAADNLQKMGYTNVISMDGGIRDWREKGYPLTGG
jgi:rhodanese-related sulfurtransferase